MNFSQLLVLELRRNVISMHLVLSISLSLALGGGIIYSIHELGGPFQPRNVAGLYASIATVALGIYCAKMVIADLHYGTIYLFFKSTKDRLRFLLSRVVVIGVVSLLFGIGCSALLYVNHLWNSQAFMWTDVRASLLHYVFFGTFFTLLFMIISMYYQKAMNLLVLALMFILVLPGLLGMVFRVDAIPAFMKDIVAFSPLYSLPSQVPFLALSNSEMTVIILVNLLLFLFAYYKLPKTDY
ncbi:hypothetical protein [Halobacillus litoralis]|uniref:Uncharacterized protein n=1 Tax=Halobacillus litoralis TaxID=45668 RepID=A0A410M9B4_9BACI|nr:hypothetical protein [Halobacillus litoralis]QAS51302.1 hypothetical protein HLI_03275 [Halobacillus litoralis]